MNTDKKGNIRNKNGADLQGMSVPRRKGRRAGAERTTESGHREETGAEGTQKNGADGRGARRQRRSKGENK